MVPCIFHDPQRQAWDMTKNHILLHVHQGKISLGLNHKSLCISCSPRQNLGFTRTIILTGCELCWI